MSAEVDFSWDSAVNPSEGVYLTLDHHTIEFPGPGVSRRHASTDSEAFIIRTKESIKQDDGPVTWRLKAENAKIWAPYFGVVSGNVKDLTNEKNMWGVHTNGLWCDSPQCKTEKVESSLDAGDWHWCDGDVYEVTFVPDQGLLTIKNTCDGTSATRKLVGDIQEVHPAVCVFYHNATKDSAMRVTLEGGTRYPKCHELPKTVPQQRSSTSAATVEGNGDAIDYVSEPAGDTGSQNEGAESDVGEDDEDDEGRAATNDQDKMLATMRLMISDMNRLTEEVQCSNREHAAAMRLIMIETSSLRSDIDAVKLLLAGLVNNESRHAREFRDDIAAAKRDLERGLEGVEDRMFGMAGSGSGRTKNEPWAELIAAEVAEGHIATAFTLALEADNHHRDPSRVIVMDEVEQTSSPTGALPTNNLPQTHTAQAAQPEGINVPTVPAPGRVPHECAECEQPSNESTVVPHPPPPADDSVLSGEGNAAAPPTPATAVAAAFTPNVAIKQGYRVDERDARGELMAVHPILEEFNYTATLCVELHEQRGGGAGDGAMNALGVDVDGVGEWVNGAEVLQGVITLFVRHKIGNPNDNCTRHRERDAGEVFASVVWAWGEMLRGIMTLVAALDARQQQLVVDLVSKSRSAINDITGSRPAHTALSRDVICSLNALLAVLVV